MKTKFTKIAVCENPPEEGTVQIFLTEGGLRKVILYRAKWFQEERYSLYKYYLIESPDREDEMIEMLEKYHNLFQKMSIYPITSEVKSLLQSLKQPSFSNEAKSN